MLVAMRCPVVSTMLQYRNSLETGSLSNTSGRRLAFSAGTVDTVQSLTNIRSLCETSQYLDEAFQALFVTVHGCRLFVGQPQLSVLLIWVLDLS